MLSCPFSQVDKGGGDLVEGGGVLFYTLYFGFHMISQKQPERITKISIFKSFAHSIQWTIVILFQAPSAVEINLNQIFFSCSRVFIEFSSNLVPVIYFFEFLVNFSNLEYNAMKRKSISFMPKHLKFGFLARICRYWTDIWLST